MDSLEITVADTVLVINLFLDFVLTEFILLNILSHDAFECGRHKTDMENTARSLNFSHSKSFM